MHQDLPQPELLVRKPQLGRWVICTNSSAATVSSVLCHTKPPPNWGILVKTGWAETVLSGSTSGCSCSCVRSDPQVAERDLSPYPTFALPLSPFGFPLLPAPKQKSQPSLLCPIHIIILVG